MTQTTKNVINSAQKITLQNLPALRRQRKQSLVAWDVFQAILGCRVLRGCVQGRPRGTALSLAGNKLPSCLRHRLGHEVK